MAERRMFAMKVVDGDDFLDLPISAQALYFQLGMRADDDGFISSPKRKAVSVGATAEDLESLVNSGFLISFDNGVSVIVHWRQHNSLRKDRLKTLQYPDLAAQLYLKDGLYSLLWEEGSTTLLEYKTGIENAGKPTGNQVATNGKPTGNQWLPEKKGNEKKGNEMKRNEMKGEEGKGNEGDVPPLSLPDTQNDFLFDDDKDGSVYDEEAIKVKPIGGSLGRGLVMLSEKQIELLLNELSIEEFDRYVDVVANQIEKGRTYGKTHYQAILDMAAQDRAIGGR